MMMSPMPRVWMKPIFMVARRPVAAGARVAPAKTTNACPAGSQQRVPPRRVRLSAALVGAGLELLGFLLRLRAGRRTDLHRVLRHAERERELGLVGVLGIEIAAHSGRLHARGLGRNLGSGNDGELGVAAEAERYRHDHPHDWISLSAARDARAPHTST